MAIYKVYPNNPAPSEQPLYVQDERSATDLGSTLANDGFLVSNAVEIAWSWGAYTDENGVTHTAYYFEADPAGTVILMASDVRRLAEVVVPPDAQPMP